MWFWLSVLGTVIFSLAAAWLGYYIAARVFIFHDVPVSKSLLISMIETLYIVLIIMVQMFPMGRMLGLGFSIMLPYLMIKVVKQAYEIRILTSIIIFVTSLLIQSLLFSPLLLVL